MKHTYTRPLFARLLNPTPEEKAEMEIERAEQEEIETTKRAEDMAQMLADEAKYNAEMAAKYPTYVRTHAMQFMWNSAK